jgi:cobalt-zinc-cadmium resistance protein CzcA
MVFVISLIGWGIYSVLNLPVDAVPDITSNQVQIITTTPDLAAEEVEKFITTPVELSMQNLPGVVEIRSISRFGLSVVTVVFQDKIGKYLPRQLVSEKLKEAERSIPTGMGNPEMAPITTGLGEIYQYIVRTKDGFEDKYSLSDLRTIQDWIVKRQLSGIPGVIEVNTLGGHLKQYEVALDPEYLRSVDVTVTEVLDALQRSNENTGGAYIEKDPNSYYIRSEGMVNSLEDIGKIVVKTRNGVPILISDVAEVGFGKAPRFGATTYNGKGEVVSGLVLMLKDENAAKITSAVEKRVEQINQNLPEGVVVEPFLVRSDLIGRAIKTVEKNLIEGGLIVIFILVLLLGNLRAGFIVASVIPLSMLFAISMMNVLGISANLMSLGAIDFGLIVDGAVIIVESIVHRLQLRKSGQVLSKEEMDAEVTQSAIKIRKSAAFGEVIILMVYIPILALTGIEGKMFRPMAMTVGLAITGALILSLTYVPMMSALFLSRKITQKKTWADSIVGFLNNIYTPVRDTALKYKTPVVVVVLILFVFSLSQFNRLGGEFIPTLEEGDFALHQILPPGSSLEKSVEVSGLIQEKLLENFPEVEKVITKIGAAEVPIDPMPVETGDIMVIMAPRKDWVSASTRTEMFDTMETVLNEIPGINYEFTQPIQMRFNELMTGSRGDIAVKIYGEDLDVLYEKGKEAERIISGIEGIGSIKVEQISGLEQIIIRYKYAKLAQYGLHVKDLNRIIRAAFAGEIVGTVFEGDRRFDLAVRLREKNRKDIEDVRRLYIPLPNNKQVPLQEVADINFEEAPQQISRDDAKRRIVISVNTGSLDTENLVEKMQSELADNLMLPAGYYITYGGQFENLIKAQKRLLVAVPVALFIIFVLLYFTFNSTSQAMLIFTAIPLSAIGGIWALWFRDMPFSISAGIGFIALFGVAVLNGIVLIAYFNQLKKEGMDDIKQRVIEGTNVRLRPVIMTASVASFGFLPMALSTSAGAEVQRPLATVVIGGLITATLLTLIVLPILYIWLEKFKARKIGDLSAPALIITALLLAFSPAKAQTIEVSMEQAIDSALLYHPSMQVMELNALRDQKMIGAGTNIPNTQFFYTGDALGMGSGLSEHSVGFNQPIQLPGAYKKRNKLLEANYEVSKENKEVTAREISQTVASTYNDWEWFIALDVLLQKYDSIYSSFNDVAQKRYSTGESNKLEVITAETKNQNLLILKDQNQENINIAFGLLRSLTGIQSDFTQPFGKVYNALDIAPTDSLIAKHPSIQLIEKQESAALAGIEAAQSLNAPMLNFGYAYQVFNGVSGLTGLRLGASIPIFRKSQNSKIEAAMVDQQIAQAQMNERILQLNMELNRLQKSLKKYRSAIDYYKEKGSDYSSDLLNNSSIGYELGQIGYMQYIQAIEQAFMIEYQYLENLNRYNQTVISINYLSLNSIP